MKFIKVKKRKFYPTWVSNRRIKGYKAYVFMIPDLKLYHFHIIYENNIIYVSLEDDLKFSNFRTCCKVAEAFIKNYIKRGKTK